MRRPQLAAMVTLAVLSLTAACDTAGESSSTQVRECTYEYTRTVTHSGVPNTTVFSKDWRCPESAPVCLRKHSPPRIVAEALVDDDYGCTTLSAADRTCGADGVDTADLPPCSCSVCESGQICAVYDANVTWAYAVCVDPES